MRKRIEAIVLVLLIIISLVATHLYTVFYTPGSRDGGTRVVFIPKGASFRMIAESLEKEGVVRDAESFIFAANILGAYKKVKAGEYEFSRAMTPMEVLEHLVKGRVKKHFVTIPEGYNLYEVAAVLGQMGFAKPEEFIALAKNPARVKSFGLEGETFEGYLFPDTYELTKGMSAQELLSKMAERFKAVYSAEFESVAREKGLSMKKVVTLASIIEKETGAPEERELISAVFQNRLKKGIKLQSDPTVIYAIEGFDGNIKKTHLQMKNPYNTYMNYGLPPGPIANPGKASIKAALYPANEDYLYFVSKNDGTHYFSKDLKEHNDAVFQYQKSRRVNGQSGKKG